MKFKFNHYSDVKGSDVNLKNFKFMFDNYTDLKGSYGESNQDLFVITILKGKRLGSYIEMGSRDPIVKNNTYMLERDFNWSGVSFDIDSLYFEMFNSTRINKTFLEDATQVDITKYISNRYVDYISLDLEPPTNTLAALENIINYNVDFAVLTFEHDSYKIKNGVSGKDIKQKAYKLLTNLGYVRIVNNGMSWVDHEDWYVNPKYVDIEWAKTLSYDLDDHITGNRDNDIRSGFRHFFDY